MRYLLLAGAFTIAVVLSASSAIAQDEDKIDCKKAQSDVNLSICASRSEQQSYQEMQAVYQQLEKKYQSEKEGPKDYREKQWRFLKVSQQDWVAYRRTHCRWVASKFDGGTLHPVLEISCLDGLNKQRMAQLLDNLEY
jgi:uncharacterized protein YecT (DUF1311 family)